MPRKCSIRGCKTNYDSETENYSTFSLPKDETLRSKWLKSIPNDLSELKHPVICIKHFDESCVSWTDVIYSKGERKEYPRKIPKLAEGAVPSIFPNAPEYLSTDMPSTKAPPTIIVALPSTSKKTADSEAESVAFVGCEVSLREGVSDCLEEKIIELARSKPALYDTNHPDYFKGKVKQDIWKEIAKKLELGSAGAAKSVWEKLRNNHRDALRRQRTAVKSGVDPRTIKKWRYQKQMEFLLKYMTLRPYDSSFEDDGDSDKFKQDIEYGDDDIVLESLPIEDALQDDINIVKHGDVPELYPTYEEPPSTLNDNNKRVKRQEGHGFLKQQNEQRAKKKKMIEDDSPSDELYYFFLAMYKMTKKMPAASQHSVRKKVFEAVSQAEADLLDMEEISQHSYQYDSTSYITDDDQADSTMKILPDND